jgi:L-iditol 2-dehydrogenase
MRAAIWYEPGKLEVQQIEDPACSQNDLMLKVLLCNICGSDLRTYMFGSASIKSGTVLGHEFVGRVLQAPAWSEFSTGHLVTAAQDIPCEHCWYCLHNMEHVCENKMEFGKHFQGAFAEYMVIPEVALRQGWVKRVPETMTKNAATLIEPVSSCVHTQSIVSFKLSENVLIVGGGPIGCIHGELAKHAGADAVILSDLSEARLERAKRFGFTRYVNASSVNLIDFVRESFPLGMDKVISANPSPDALAEAIQLVRKGGTVIAFGGLPKDNFTVKADGNRIHYDEVTLTGSYAYSRKENDLAFKYIAEGVVSADQYITSVYPLEDIVEGMKKAQKAEGMKVQIKIN